MASFTFADSNNTVLIQCVLNGATDVQIPFSVTNISGSAFFQLSTLVSVDFSLCSNLLRIESDAFKGCGLTSLSLPASLQFIGNDAFKLCPIASVTLPASLEFIGDGAFAETSLASVTVNANLKSIGDYAFSKCPLVSLVLPASLESIGDGAFNECKLTSLDLSACDKLESIGAGAFQKSRLTAVDLASCAKLDSIGANAFAENYSRDANGVMSGNDKSALSLTVHANLKMIGVQAFKDCNIASVDFLHCVHLQDVALNAFDASVAYYLYKYVYFNDTVTLTHSVVQNVTDVVIPSNVTHIGEDAFSSSGVTSVTFPISLVSIGVKSFESCKLLAVDLSDCIHLESIGDTAFAKGRDVVGASPVVVTLPPNLKSIGIGAFAANPLIRTIAIPSKVEFIRIGAFADTNLTSVTFTNSSQSVLSSIGNYAFAGTSLTSITFPARLKSIGSRAFSKSYVDNGVAKFLGCPLINVTFSNLVNLEHIGANAFDGCRLYNVDLSNCAKLTVIGAGAFANNYDKDEDGTAKLTDGATSTVSVTLPVNLENINALAFESCNIASVDFSLCVHLQNVASDAFDAAVEYYWYKYEYMKDVVRLTQATLNNVTEVTIPDNVTHLGLDLFKHKSSLAIVNFGSEPELVSIGANAFDSCGLSSVSLPLSLESIGDYAFYGSNNYGELTVEFRANLRTIGNNAFAHCIIHTDKQPVNTLNLLDCIHLESIGASAFEECSLVSIKLPDSLRSIGLNAFMTNTELAYSINALELPKRLDSIGQNAFKSTKVMTVKMPSSILKAISVLQANPDTAIFPFGCSLQAFPGVKVNLNIVVNPDSKVLVFGEPEEVPGNVIIANYKLPVDALYDSENNCGLIEMIDNANDIDVTLADSENVKNAYKKSAIKLAYAFERSLCDSFDCSGAEPFADYHVLKYTTQSDFGRLSLNCFAHFLMGHIDAALAITNDVSFMENMLSLSDALEEVKDSSLQNKLGVSSNLSTSGDDRFNANNLNVTFLSDILSAAQTNSGNARLAQLLVKSILLKGMDANNVLTISTIEPNVLPPSSSLANIVAQVISQDLNRAMGKNNRVPVLLPFYAGDIIYVNIKLMRPSVTVGNGQATEAETIKNRYTKDINYAIQFTLGDSSNVEADGNLNNATDVNAWLDAFKASLHLG